ncbi:MAG: putative rhomboid protease [Lichina confinis]|nr:MAG: putative rhomboid protease [Lichina confinis]
MALFPSLPRWNPARLRSYLLRLPLATRIVIVVTVFIWVFGMLLSTAVWDVVAWGALVPEKVNLSSMHRINTYPLIHASALHFLLNLPLAVLLLERFEAGNGTLVTVVLLAGPFSTFPAGLYLLFEKVIWRGNAAVMGLSTWVSLLIAIEMAKTFKSNPHFKWVVFRSCFTTSDVA